MVGNRYVQALDLSLGLVTSETGTMLSQVLRVESESGVRGVLWGGMGREWNGSTPYFCKKDAKTLVLL